MRKASPLGLAVLALVVCAFPATLRAERPMTPADVAALESVDRVVISPDGADVAYVRVVPRTPFEDEDGPAWQELHVVTADGTSRGYVTGEVNVDHLAWTGDGRHITFVAERGEDEEAALYSIPLTGGESRKILTHETGVSAYDWSHDGERVAFLAKEERGEDEEELEEKGFDAVIYEEELRPTRLWIAAPSAPDAEEPASEARLLDLDGHVVDVDWCQSGPRIAAAIAPRPLVDDVYMFTRLEIVDPGSETEAGGIVTEIDNPGKLGVFAMSPDCSKLAFVSGADIHDPREGRLMIADTSTGEFTELLVDYEGHVRNLAWRDADTLVFLGDEGVETLIYQIEADGADLEVLEPAGDVAWSDVSLSADGSSMALTGMSARHPHEAFLASGDGGPTRLTESNPWLSEIAFGAQQTVTYEARDGLEIEGLVIRPIRPLDGEPEARPPLIVKVHGGPESHYRDGWLTSYSTPGQVGAGSGYTVFYPNYRGSTGRGVEFSKLSQARPAREEFDDIVDGVDHLIERGLVDREKVGITGGSYGGYASAWGATYYSDRFAAAVMSVGISNKISKLGTSDIPEELHLVHERKRLWDDWQHFLEASPIYYVERAETPILILHGAEDTRVDPSQSMELYRALEILEQVPVRLVLYPGEGHGNRDAAARYDFNLRMMRWFDHYLKGAGGEKPPPQVEYPLREQVEDDDEAEDDGAD